MQDTRVIKSYVWHNDKCFFISTIERDCSAILAPGRYNETLAWEYDWATHTRCQQIAQEEDARGSLIAHMQLCQRLHQTGKPNITESQ